VNRAEFDVPDGVAYLNCAYMSPLPRAVREAGAAAVARKARPWEIAPADFFTDAERLRALAARLLGGDAEGVAIVPSVSYAMAAVAGNLRVGAGERILVIDEEFPSNVYPWRALAGRTGAEVATVARPADGDWTAAVLAALDERVAVVAAPNCHWTDGGLIDLVRVGAAAREAGAALVVDATQSLGALPLDVAVVRPDAVVAAAYKWLLGPYSMALLHLAPALRDGRPLEEGWIARRGSEDFSGLVDYRDDYQPGARRFDVGERSNFALLPMAVAALELILRWGVERIAAAIAPLTDLVEETAAALGLGVPPAGSRAGHMTRPRPAGPPPAGLAAALADAGVHVSVRGRSLRVSPHVYNTPDDVARLGLALERALAAS
jgi:selenocysteine lyase/cysteine desulfurase